MLDCPRCDYLVEFEDGAETVCCPECRCVCRIEYDADCVGDPPEFVPCNSLVPLQRFAVEPIEPERCRGCGMLVRHQVELDGRWRYWHRCSPLDLRSQLATPEPPRWLLTT